MGKQLLLGETQLMVDKEYSYKEGEKLCLTIQIKLFQNRREENKPNSNVIKQGPV